MTPLMMGGHASSTHFRLEAVGHYAAALAQGVARTPQIISTDAVEHYVNAVTRKTVNLVHEIRALVVDGNAAQFSDHEGPLGRAGSVHRAAGQPCQLQHRGADATRSPVDQHTLSGLGVRRSMQHLI